MPVLTNEPFEYTVMQKTKKGQKYAKYIRISDTWMPNCADESKFRNSKFYIEIGKMKLQGGNIEKIWHRGFFFKTTIMADLLRNWLTKREILRRSVLFYFRGVLNAKSELLYQAKK